MNQEAEDLKQKIKNFLNKQELELESQYFLLLSLTEEIKDEIMDDDEDLEDLTDDDFEDPEEDSEEDEPEPTPIVAKKPIEKPNQDHKLKIKSLFKKPVINKPKIKVEKDFD